MRARIVLIAALAAALAVTAASAAHGRTRKAPHRAAATTLATGRHLYRQYCGQCHALKQALAAGFGSNGPLGDLGGPSFNNLRVPYSFSITAVTEPTGGHEQLRKKITGKELVAVARYIARVTRHNALPALPTDG